MWESMKERMVRAVAPTRVDFAGGTLDLWPIHCVIGPCATVNMGVDLSAEVTISRSSSVHYEFESTDQGARKSGDWQQVTASKETILVSRFVRALWHPDWGPIRVQTRAKSPAGAGLGGSSALAIALAGALCRARSAFDDIPLMGERDMVALASNVEAGIIEIPTGIQDYWGAIRGGLNILRFPEVGPQVVTHRLEDVSPISSKLLLCFSGKSRASARNNWDIFRAVFEKNEHVLGCLRRIAGAAVDCANALESSDWQGFFAASQREWGERERLWPDIHTIETRALTAAAARGGAHFSRVCGAGGGGVMAIFVDEERRAAVARELKAAGGQVLDANPSAHGLVVEGEV